MSGEARSVAVIGPNTVAGPALVRRLLAGGARVTVLAPPESLALIRYPVHTRQVVGRPDERGAVRETVEGADVVYYLPGLTAFPGTEPALPPDLDPRGLKAAVRACVQGGGRLVYVGTVTVYRPTPSPEDWPIAEDVPRLAHGNPLMHAYGQSRIDAEDLLRRAGREQGLEYVILRPTSVYGPGVRFAEDLVRLALLRPRLAQLLGAGLGTMQWVHVDDLARAMVRAGTRRRAAGRAINVAGAENVTVRSLVEMVHGPSRRPRPRRGAGWWGAGWEEEETPARFDTERARRLLGFRPRVRLVDGIRKLMEEMEDGGHFDAPPAGPGALRARASAPRRGAGGRGAAAHG